MAKSRGKEHSGAVRIIAGKWRRRMLAVGAAGGLRPTPDRVRETVFNWLAPILPGARCLDLFAGTGALGFEAASRGATEVVLVERDAKLVNELRQAKQMLGADAVEVHRANAIAWLNSNPAPFDLVFLDPPYDSDLLRAACEKLSATTLLRPNAMVYLETRAELHAASLPPDWSLHRSGKAGQVRYHLASVARQAIDENDNV